MSLELEPPFLSIARIALAHILVLGINLPFVFTPNIIPIIFRILSTKYSHPI
ncbi:uncharacterized protein CC84DRAFT_1162742 [Paraphaeosphaeria sporulosa]|uniref:Uncharacterized protein n=1 Tax=Paraphaeosphaeria sporulosa TaxID=1460663 RepID=A0A177CNQ6_9PLEO|nr:uncharacterized protein CC84DRAFT_1162742 [Paraphaeosphaeria sporulosa]OAG08916.1 hypothetical protein CC84DRAFT_1162742 [Paraphaeosphaeria sporulosa]